MTTALFETARLRCRRWQATDLDAILAVYSDAEAMRWVGDGQPISIEACRDWLKVTEDNYLNRGYGMFALEARDTGAIVGFCGLVHPGGQLEPEVKYAFLRGQWGKGLASEAIPALLAYGAATHLLFEVTATVAPENVRSKRVLLKSGLILVSVRNNSDGSSTNVYKWRAQNAV